ncbi:hypothetical protein H5R88_06995 [Limosilactobacillus sp. WF-MT5-A]|uniref:hypothetical protein n=1 Tax=Limosilactobacillus agrestis TaxID=2759748 RepID=UPI0015F9074D|nr:hypothetical protein [Limosilactobacillus agrestis]MBB1099850.1 hypothetical protein [Limosilactobacillus agrestis]MCD7126033.1 hypothetical protein [Limosilactobacillus agrestis]
MNLDKLKNAIDSQNKAERKMTDTVLSQLNFYRNDIKELADYCSNLVDSKGKSLLIILKLVFLKHTNSIGKAKPMELSILICIEGKIAIDIRDTSHDLENIEYRIDIKGPALPVELVIKNSKKQVDNINNRISQFNNF